MLYKFENIVIFGPSYGCHSKDLLIISQNTPHNAVFGFTDHEANFQLINHLLLIFKYFIYNARENRRLDLKDLRKNINKVRNVEKRNKQKIQRQRKAVKENGKPF